jgi:hypothetical protein
MSEQQTTQQEDAEQTTSVAVPVSVDQAHEFLFREGSTEEARVSGHELALRCSDFLI